MITIALSFHHNIFLEDIQYMTILSREERERLVIELYYNQGKTYREISKEARISPRDIGIILNKAIEEKKSQGSKEEEQDNIDLKKNQNQEQQQPHLSLAAEAYKHFSEGKTPLEVSIELNLRESQATKFYRECWKLQHLHNLNTVYEEIKEDIALFLKLYKLAKAKRIGVKQIVDVLAIAKDDLPAIEERYKRLGNDVSMLQSQKHTCKRNLYLLNNQIATTSRLSNSLCISCERKRRELENLCNEKAKLEATVTEFKSNNEEYLNKIKQAAEESAKTVLTNSKLFLRFATASVIESLRRNSELCNFVLNGISNNNNTDRASYRSNYLSLMLPGQKQQSFGYISDYIFAALILEEAEKLYNELTTKLTNEVMTAAVAVRASS
jgi:3-dehydroquinate dehydratase